MASVRAGRRRRTAAGFALALALFASALGVAFQEWIQVPPRLLAWQLEARAEGHAPWIVRLAQRLADAFVALDRDPPLRPGSLVAARPMRSASGDAARAARTVRVATAQEALAAIADAQPGDAIEFAPGRYEFHDHDIEATRPGRKDAPITLRAERPGSAVLLFAIREGFVVTAPYWTFENLVIRGACSAHDDCQHAFHVSGAGHHFKAVDNEIVDFNAHFKVNASGNRVPDDGVIEGNTLTNTTVRDTEQPVVPIDIVAASGWRVEGNVISDFVKGRANRISYGAFAKGGGARNRFLRNIVYCEYRLRGHPGQRIGLSLGGGGTGSDFCRDRQCITEQDEGVIAGNLIAGCSDEGIYVNSAAISTISYNTLIDTAGISVRFVESSAELEGNLVDGTIRARDGAALHGQDNLQSSLTRGYIGSHPLRALFADWRTFDFAWAGPPPRRQASDGAIALCSTGRVARRAYGAFEDFQSCKTMPVDTHSAFHKR